MTIEAMLAVAKEASYCESYEDTEQTIKSLTKICTNDDTIRVITNTIGNIVFANDMKISNDIFDKFNSGKIIFPSKKLNHVLYLECDGAMIATRPDKNDKKAKKLEKKVIWRENKSGMAFSTDNMTCIYDKKHERQHTINKKEYIGLIGNNDDFSKLMLSLAIRNGYGVYNTTVLISDGATWIRNMKEIYFPDAIQILDFYLLSEYIYTFAKEIYDFDVKKYDRWAKKLIHLFKNSKIDDAINMIKKVPKAKLSKASSDLLQYIDNNRDHIEYSTYIEKGFFIGSGAIESGNKIVLQRRMKQGGMRWNLDSAQSLVSLCAKRRSGLWKRDVDDLTYIKFAGAPGNEVKKRIVPFLPEDYSQAS
jgi:hypothetical protein